MWQTTIRDLDALLDSSDHPVTILANSAAFLFRRIEQINWLGFYLYDGSKLYLGPFAGKPACTTIGLGKGVCGTAAEKREIVVVEDVNLFPGHIVCDPDSRSEIVLPLILQDGTLVGVFDIDSAIPARFGTKEKEELQKIAAIITRKIAQTRALETN